MCIGSIVIWFSVPICRHFIRRRDFSFCAMCVCTAAGPVSRVFFVYSAAACVIVVGPAAVGGECIIVAARWAARRTAVDTVRV